MTGSSSFWFSSSAAFYNRIATQSLRFEDGDGAYLYRTPSSAGNRRTFTFSAWIKRGNFDENNAGSGDDTTIFSAGTSSVFDSLRFVSQSFTSIKNILQVYTFDGSNDYSEEVNRGFRDASSWYHIVFAVDTTQSTAGNRIKYYVNGELQTSVSQYYAQVPQNYQTSYNHTEPQWIGRNVNSTGRYFDGYMAEINFVDGTQYAASDFGETKDGVWIAKEPNVTYGTNGFRLQFKGVGGSANSSGIGADTSGNGNHFSISGFTGYDSVWKDCPENNFATLNPLIKPHGALEYLEGNLKITRGSVDAYSFAISTLTVKTGKWYAELRPQGTITSNNHMVGVCVSDLESQSSGDPYLKNGQISYVALGNGHVDDGGSINASTFSGSTSFAAGDVVGVALDLDSATRTVKFYINNSLVNTSSYGNLSSEFDGEHIGFMSILFGTNTCMWNFGQDSTFANQITQGGNADGNGIGDFKYSPPSGYLALCTSNLSTPNIGPNSDTQAIDHFDTLTWTATASRHIIHDRYDGAGVGLTFKPDWVWGKKRSSGDSHALVDSTRGVTKEIRTDSLNQEATNSNGVESFDAPSSSGATDGGFTLVGSGSGSGVWNGNSGATHVAWNWKANGGTTSSVSGGTNISNGTSNNATVQANTSAGFSIVLTTNTTRNGSDMTIPHGLGATPHWILSKALDNDNIWTMYHREIPNNALFLGGSYGDDAKFSSTPYNSVGSSTFDHQDNSHTQSTNEEIIFYCFTEIEGYSKFGSYEGNGNADGPFVYTGFTPSFILLKNADRAANWRLHDIVRQPINDDGGHMIQANLDSGEVTGEYDLDICSSGFKLKSGDVYENADGETHVYIAFAEAPIKFANAR